MSPLPAGTQLGALHLVETYVHYEGPRLFLARSASGLDYIGLFVDEDEDSETYLYVLITKQRLAMVRSGGMSLREALTYPEGPIFSVRIAAGGEPRLALVEDGVPDRWLPAEGAR